VVEVYSVASTESPTGAGEPSVRSRAGAVQRRFNAATKKRSGRCRGELVVIGCVGLPSRADMLSSSARGGRSKDPPGWRPDPDQGGSMVESPIPCRLVDCRAYCACFWHSPCDSIHVGTKVTTSPRMESKLLMGALPRIVVHVTLNHRQTDPKIIASR